MKLIEKYYHKGKGYNPFLITSNWQVAQLNYSDEQDFKNIKRIEVHFKTDEVFVLMKGKAVLIGAEINGSKIKFETYIMKQGVTYNVPKNVWHSIAMSKDAEVLIVEDKNTHKGNYDILELDKNQIEILKKMLFKK